MLSVVIEWWLLLYLFPTERSFLISIVIQRSMRNALSENSISCDMQKMAMMGKGEGWRAKRDGFPTKISDSVRKVNWIFHPTVTMTKWGGGRGAGFKEEDDFLPLPPFFPVGSKVITSWERGWSKEDESRLTIRTPAQVNGCEKSWNRSRTSRRGSQTPEILSRPSFLMVRPPPPPPLFFLQYSIQLCSFPFSHSACDRIATL